MEYVGTAKKIADTILNAGQAARERIQALFKHHTIEDVRVLQTMLERCAQSSNTQLKKDLIAHNIPERLKKVEELVTSKHAHLWSSKTELTFFECIQKQSDWYGIMGRVNDAIGSIAHVAMDDLEGTDVTYEERNEYEANNFGFPRNRHAKEIEKQLTWLVTEIGALYNQTNSLINANLLKRDKHLP